MDDVEIITLFLDDDKELDCQILTIFEAGGNDYIALMPLTEDYAENGEIFLYRYSEDENEEPILDNIEDEEEFALAEEAFDEWLDEAEYDEIVSEEDL